MPLPTSSHTLDSSQRALSSLQRSPNPLKRPYTPSLNDESYSLGVSVVTSSDRPMEDLEDRRQSLTRDLHARSARMIFSYFSKPNPITQETSSCEIQERSDAQSMTATNGHTSPAKRKARVIDENYDDDDEEEEEDGEGETKHEDVTSTPAYEKQRTSPSPAGLRGSLQSTPLFKSAHDNRTPAQATDQAKTSEEVLKTLEAEKKAKEKAAKESFLHTFYTLENDRDAMMEQERLDELDRQVETEMSGQDGAITQDAGKPAQGALSSANLGVNSLAFKHLIHHIDTNRNLVPADDSKLKTMFSEMRRNRSKWANEDRVGQEELYEAADRVLGELKGMTAHIAPFLQKVNKRDAPDYHVIIKHPMDIGTMIKKLKQYQYKSKKEFVDDLDLIWANCLRYNTDPNHLLRKKAEHMKRESDRLTPLIPDIVVRDRAEVEAEERRQHLSEYGGDGDDDSDEEPIIASRGRKAPSKGSKKGTSTARKAPPAQNESTPGPDSRSTSVAAGATGALPNLKNEHLRTEMDALTEISSLPGHATPPAPGSMTPLGPHGARQIPGSHADASELDEMRSSMNGVGLAQFDEPEQEDEEYKTWKHVTKKERAQVASERHKLFKSDKLNPDEPALLRTKAGMRRWVRLQKALTGEEAAQIEGLEADAQAASSDTQGTTLAEGIEGEDESVLPDYYSSVNAIPPINPRLVWQEDSQGYVTSSLAECLRLVPKGHFTESPSYLASKINSNMRQIQDTRRAAAKIGIIKQMQVQPHSYQNQFQKYRPQPLVEADVGPIVTSDDGPVMAPYVSRAALQRSVGKIFYHAGFEDFQPAALDAVTDIAAAYFHKLGRTLGVLSQQPKVDDISSVGLGTSIAKKYRTYKPRFSQEECILHTLHENGVELEDLEAYVKEDVERFGSKLETHHARMAEYHRELLRPALDPAQGGADTSDAFNDSSEQFVSGDILAEDVEEDFFGFRELGLEKEFGLSSLTVPLHLLQSRLHNAYQPASANTGDGSGNVMDEPPRYPPITNANVDRQVGIVQAFFKRKLEASADDELIEDEDLPAKQRFPKPRLPPTGKISSPRKRPLREQQMLARKKRKMELEAEREREEVEASVMATATSNGDNNVDLDHEIADTSNETNISGEAGQASQDDPTSVVDGTRTVESSSNPKSNGDLSTDVVDEQQSNSLETPTGKVRLEAPTEDEENQGDPQKVQDNADEHTNGLKTSESMPIAAH